MIQAVIFDMDGTLIDTEKYYRICWPQALAHFGYTMSDEQALSMRSLGQPYAPEHLKEMFQDPDLDYPAIRVYRKQLMEEYLERDGIQIKPGAVELLEYLKENYGLTYNEDLFYVDYRTTGANLIPDVTIIEKRN